MWDLLKKLFGLWSDVFSEYPLAAAITTVMFILAYLAWERYNQKHRIRPSAFWKQPSVSLSIGWCIVTPLLGFVFDLVSTAKELLSPLVKLYAAVFELYPAVSAVVTLAFILVYVLWKLLLKRSLVPSGKFWRYPGIILLIAWIILTPIMGFAIDLATSRDTEVHGKAAYKKGG